MPTSPPLRRTNAAHTAQATSLNFALMTAIDALDQTGKRVKSNTVTTARLHHRRIRMGRLQNSHPRCNKAAETSAADMLCRDHTRRLRRDHRRRIGSGVRRD